MNESSKILVIDDEENIRKTISLTLQHAGYTVDTAENGKQALEKSQKNFYNLALIDIRLPDMEGTELLSALPETTPRMVKMILTGYPGLPNAVTAINKGVDAYLIKPVNTEELLRVIKDRLDKQKKEKQYSEEKVSQFVETRLKELEAADKDASKSQNKE
jgi:DNA-binding NtrC family response regulator